MTHASAQPSAPKPPPAVKLPLREKLFAGMGEGVINMNVNLPPMFAAPVFNLYLGVDPFLIGLALTIPRLWDGVTDPILASFTDNARTRWGRRKPFMLAGAILTFLAGIFMWAFPAGMSEGFYFGYLLLSTMLLYTCTTIFAVPFGAMVMELTGDYHERTRLMTVRFFFTYLSSFAIAWLLALASAKFWPSEVTGSRAAGLLIAVLTLLFAAAPTFLARENEHAVRIQQEKSPLLLSVRQTLGNRPFLILIAAYTLGFLGVVMVGNIGLYVNIFYVYAGDTATASVVQGWALSAGIVTGMLTLVLINLIGTRVEKTRALQACLMVSFFGAVGSWFLYTPAYPLLQIVSKAMIFPGMGALLVMSSSMMADLCDIDESETGTRREGMYWAVFNWIQKSTLALSFTVSGLILNWSGFDEALTTQAPGTVFVLRVAYALIMGVTLAVAIVLLHYYPVDRKRLDAVRKALAGSHKKM